MKIRISESAVCSFAVPAITARIVCGVLVDMPGLCNAGWLSVLLSGALALLPAFAVSQLRRMDCRFLPLLNAAFFAVAVYDAAVVSAMIADSAGYMALNSTPSVYLMIPQLILCLVCLRLNGDALGASAGIWNRILPALLLLIFLLQVRNCRPSYLLPLLGPGASPLLTGAFRAAGWFSLPTALYLSAQPGINGPAAPFRPIRTLCFCIVYSVLICLFYSMMTPAIMDKKLLGRAFRLDVLLANGRAGLALQLPTIALWYVGLLYALLFDLFTAAAMLQTVLSRWNRSGCILLSVIIVGLLAASRLSGRSAALAAGDWLYAVQNVLLTIAMLLALRRKGGLRNA